MCICIRLCIYIHKSVSGCHLIAFAVALIKQLAVVLFGLCILRLPQRSLPGLIIDITAI